LIYPLLPVPLEGFIRCVVGNPNSNWVVNFDTFSAATLAISAGLMSVFVNQSLRTQEAALPDQADEDARNGICSLFMASGIFFFVMFGLNILMYAVVHDRKIVQLLSILRIFQATVFITWIIPVVLAVAAQRAFRLSTSLS
jgi:hypothetical protein